MIRGNAGTFHSLFDFLFRYVRLCLVAVVVHHFGLKFRLATGKAKGKEESQAKAKGLPRGKGRGKDSERVARCYRNRGIFPLLLNTL